MHKILHTIPDLNAKSGGTSTCTHDLISALVKEGVHVDLLTVAPKNDVYGFPCCDDSFIKFVPNDYQFMPYGYSYNFKKYLTTSDYDLYQANGLWMYADHITCEIARKKNKPYLITTHGMLHPKAVHRSYWKKWILLKLFFKRDINNATCIHATCIPEMEHIREFGYKGPIAVIPHPTNLPDYLPEIFSAKQSFFTNNHIKRFGFLGRLHPVKKVEYLLYALDKIKQHDVELIIMGSGDEEYETFLHSETTRLRLKNVKFKGFVNGRQKYEELVKLSCLFVPSDFENFGMIVTEALSVGTPVMASNGTPWEILNEKKCGWWIDATVENIANVMEQIRTLTTDEIMHMGTTGRMLIDEKFNSKDVAQKIKDLYSWILGQTNRPDFIYE